MGNLAVKVDNIGKQYKIFEEVNRYQTLRDVIVTNGAIAVQDASQPHRF